MKLKVTKGELIISNGLEMADAYLLGGVAAPPPPPLLGLNSSSKKNHAVEPARKPSCAGKKK